MPTKIYLKKQKGFVLGFVIIMVVALSIMTTVLFLFFDTELITYQRNKNEYLAKNAAESGLESGYRWLKNQWTIQSLTHLLLMGLPTVNLLILHV